MTLLTLDYVRTTIKTHDIDVQWAHDTLLKSARNLVRRAVFDTKVSVKAGARVQKHREQLVDLAVSQRLWSLTGTELYTALMPRVLWLATDNADDVSRGDFGSAMLGSALLADLTQALDMLIWCVHYETILKEK